VGLRAANKAGMGEDASPRPLPEVAVNSERSVHAESNEMARCVGAGAAGGTVMGLGRFGCAGWWAAVVVRRVVRGPVAWAGGHSSSPLT
jgi:hypothetical protein